MTVNSIASSQLSDSMMKLSSMKRVNSASDDAAGMAIAESMESQIKGLERGSDNTLDMQNLTKSAEAGLSSISDSLQRIRDLSLQASNDFYGDDEKSVIQQEISSLLEGIDEMASGMEFNGKKLLDGNFTDQQTASTADATGASVSIPEVSVASLGLTDFDVTGSFDIETIDNAINAVNEIRSDLGATINRFDYTVDSNSITMLNQAAAKSRIADQDVAKADSELHKARILNELTMFNYKQKNEEMKGSLSILG